MKVRYCSKNENLGVAFAAGGLGSFSMLNGLISSNIYLVGFGGALIFAGAVNLKQSMDKAIISEASIEELAALDEIKTEYSISNEQPKKEFVGKIGKFSNYEVQNICARVENVGTTRILFKETLANLVDEKGYSIPCIFPLKTKLKDGKLLCVSAYLRKIKIQNKKEKNVLFAYSFKTLDR